MKEQSLTIIIPVYNASNTILQCLESIQVSLNSNPLPMEVDIVIVNDGSTDNTAITVDSWARSNCDYPLRIIEQCQQGPSAARNTGAAVTKKDWLLFMDADVVLEQNTLDNLMNNVPDSTEIFGKNGIPIPWVPDGNWTTQYINCSLRYQLLQHGQRVNTCFTSCCLLSRAAWEKLGNWDQTRISRYSDDIQSRWFLPSGCIVQDQTVQFTHLKYVSLHGALKHRFNLGFHFRSSLHINKTKSSVVLHYRYPMNVLLAGISPLIVLAVLNQYHALYSIILFVMCSIMINFDFCIGFKSRENPSLAQKLFDYLFANGLSFLEGWSIGLGILFSFIPIHSDSVEEHDEQH